MKILIASSSPPDKGSGINTYVNQLVCEFIKLGHEVIYASPEFSQKENSHGLEFQHFIVGQDDKPEEAYTKIKNMVKEKKPDLIINNDNPYVQSIAPIVDSVFISVGHLSRSNIATLACHNKKWVDYIIAISVDMQRTFIDKYRVDTIKVPIVYNGVVDPYSGVLPDKKILKNVNLIFTGGDNKRKGANLMKTFVRDHRWKKGKYNLHWYGGLSQSFKKEILNVGNVRICGRVPREKIIEALEKEMHFFLLPSYTEGCPMSMLEAMSYGVIPIASDGIGAMDRMVIHGQEGFICRLNNWADDVFSCLENLSESEGLFNSIRMNTYKRFSSEFRVDILVKKLLQLSKYPTVNRDIKPDKIDILRWHRPTIPGTNKAPLFDRFLIRSGILLRAETIKNS